MPSWPGQWIPVDGLELNVVVAGSGPDVLLVHGFPDDHGVWREQIGTLVGAGYRVIAPDTRGCGESGIAAKVADYRIEHLVADLIAILDAQGVGKARVVAHDWGAIQAWHLALRHPERVERLIVLSVGHPASYANGGLMQKLRAYYVWLFQLRGVAEWLIRRFDWLALRLLTGFPQEAPRWRSLLGRPGRLTAALNYYRANQRQIWSAPDARAEVPVVGLWSRGDRFLVERQMRDSERYCTAGWRYVRLEHCNHWPQLTAADECNRLLLHHLA